MRRRIAAITLAAASLLTVAGPAGALTQQADVTADDPFYICTESRLMQHNICFRHKFPDAV